MKCYRGIAPSSEVGRGEIGDERGGYGFEGLVERIKGVLGRG
jgi:hypothetical protein